MVAGSLQSSPRSFANDQLIKRSTDGSSSIFDSDDGKFIVFSNDKTKEVTQIRLDDVYAVFRNGLELKLESCPRVVSRKKWFFGVKHVKPKNPFERVCQAHTFSLGNDLEADEWCIYIKKEVAPCYSTPLVEGSPLRNLLVLVNPIGGKRKGEEMYHELLKPMLDGAGTGHEVIVTTGPGHAEEVAKTFDIYRFGAVAIVGGDGLFGEFLNGLNKRDDRLQALLIPLGVVPAGSSNCIACSVGLRQPLAACFAIARGKAKPMDVLKVTLTGEDLANPNPHVMLSMCGVSYGFISEVNTHAGKWRRLFGPARYTVCGFRTLVSSPMKYHVDCRFIAPSHDCDPEFDKTECGPDCLTCEHAGHSARRLGVVHDPSSPSPPDPSYVSNGLCTNAPDQVWTDSVVSMGPRRRSVKPECKNLDNSSLLLLSVTNLAIRQSQNWTVWNANSHMSSGYMDLVMMPVLSRTQLLKFFSNYNKGGGKHKEDPNVFSIIKAQSVEMRITNADSFPEWEREIKIAIDGETYPLQPLRVDNLHGFLNFICC